MTVIKIENLWKQYRLGVIGHGTLQADLQSWWARKWGKEDPNAKIAAMYKGQEQQVEGDRFWALRDIKLEVQQGEILGIIGKNGAGKSTLLKILSRVTAPTRGAVKIKGRIASLLEVGTGFHPELTGRENIFLNGAILGMTKAEIRSKFDEIVDFSGVEQFIDTPVKRYSSGMKVRLAFAVAAHLEPEIMVVDEVLAVGDHEFQQKCLGKMQDVAGEGRTVLFVSHNLNAVQSLCNTGVVLESGIVGYQGAVQQAVEHYLSPLSQGSGGGVVRFEPKPNLPAQILEVSTRDEHGDVGTVFPYHRGLALWMDIQVHHPNKDYYADFILHNARGDRLFFSADNDARESHLSSKGKGRMRYRVRIPGKILRPGRYYITPAIGMHVDRGHDFALSFDIVDDTSLRARSGKGYRDFPIAPELEWIGMDI